MEIPLPEKLIEIARNDSEHDNSCLLAVFPIVGLIVGALLITAATIINVFVPAKTASAIIGALILCVLTEIFLAGGNIFSLTAFIQAKKSGFSNFETAAVVDAASAETSQINQLYLISIYCLKVVAFALLIFYDRMTWIVIVYALSFLIRSQMAQWNDIRTSQPLIDAKKHENAVKLPWIFASAITVFIAGFNFFPAALAAVLASYFLIRFFSKILKGNRGGVSPGIIAGAGTFSELVLLMIGVILLVRN